MDWAYLSQKFREARSLLIVPLAFPARECFDLAFVACRLGLSNLTIESIPDQNLREKLSRLAEMVSDLDPRRLTRAQRREFSGLVDELADRFTEEACSGYL